MTNFGWSLPPGVSLRDIEEYMGGEEECEELRAHVEDDLRMQHINDPFCTCDACMADFEESWRQSTAGQALQHLNDVLVGKEPEQARCVECGTLVSLEVVYNCCQQAIEPTCGHSWWMYQHDGQYVLE